MGKFVEKEGMCVFYWRRIPKNRHTTYDQAVDKQGTAIKEGHQQ